MPLKYRQELRDGYLLVCCSGSPDSPVEFFRYIKSSVLMARKANLPCVLFDETGVSLKFNVHDTVLMSDKLDAEGLQNSGVRGAIVCSTHDLTIYKYFETSLRNRSFNVMMFDNFVAAKRWLLREDDSWGGDGGTA